MNRITHHRKFLRGRLLLLLTLLLSTTALTSYAGNDRRVDYTGTQEIDVSVAVGESKHLKKTSIYIISQRSHSVAKLALF